MIYRTAVDNAVSILDAAHYQLLRLNDSASRRLVIQHNGCVLIEAPTGAGKTLIAGHTAERFSKNKRVVWFWFAPFAGLIEQSIRTIKTEFTNLNVKDAKKDRTIDGIQSGDIFVTTWGSVAANNSDSRKTRNNSDELLSLDVLVPALKGMGYHIGVIVDEAHHGFKKAQEALSFYSKVLDPEYTIMVTATPKDRDVDTFKQATGFIEVHKIAISRDDCIDAGLVKVGIKAIAFSVDDESKAITDFEKTTLRCGYEKHLEIQAELEASDIDLKPLMLVQVDNKSDSNTVEDARKKLLEMGVPASQIATHTAEEPDPHLLALAQDESVRFLIFKIAVALGFDCPRAFTLVSMRRSRDADFGVQVVGRIMRVHRLLQGKEVSDLLKYGYVVLADYSAQEGLTGAAERINSIKSQLSSASTVVGLVVIGNAEIEAQKMKGGQASFWTEPPKPAVPLPGTVPPMIPPQPGDATQITFFDGETIPAPGTTNTTVPAVEPSRETGKVYYLRKDLEYPKSFKSETCTASMVDNIAKCIASQLNLDGDIFNVVYKRFANATKRETEIFTDKVVTVEAQVDISMKEIHGKAHDVLFSDENINGKTLQTLLIARLKDEFKRKGLMGGETHDQLEDALSLILATHPKVVKDAKRKCYANFIQTQQTASIPDYIKSPEALPPSSKNIYGIFPAGLTSDEKEFANLLDNDVSGTVLWWHRNPDRKPFSVSLVMPDIKHDFYPDFIIGVKGRDTEDSILLVEVKGEIYRNDVKTIAKARGVHKIYKKVLMVEWQERRQWMTVVNDPKTEHNITDQQFRFTLMETW